MNQKTETNALKDAEAARPQPAEMPSKREHQWWETPAFWLSICSLMVALYSALNTSRSANAAIRSANAAAISASAAMTNADWVSYQRTPHHDVLARVLRVGTVPRGFSEEDTNGLAYVDLALINNGNQSEIIRRVTLYYDENESDGGIVSPQILNSQLPKGDKQVLHLVLDRKSAFTGNYLFLKVGVTAIAPDAEDIESKWIVAKMNLATDGNGSWVSPYTAKAIQVISNQRLPHQRETHPFM